MRQNNNLKEEFEKLKNLSEINFKEIDNKISKLNRLYEKSVGNYMYFDILCDYVYNSHSLRYDKELIIIVYKGINEYKIKLSELTNQILDEK